MSEYTFNYSFNINGNATVATEQITEHVAALSNIVKQASGLWDSFAEKVAAFNRLSQFVEGFSRTFNETLVPGAALNASLADLSAISGQTGDNLRAIERYARDAAKTFGGSAAQSVESYKLLLSQLSPELAQTPDALKAMGDNITVLGKTMGGDAKAAADVLTTAMTQYGVSLADPMEASRKMTQMMNVMAAAGQAGSAGLPTIKVALEQCGTAAKAAGVSFEETNAAIQVLDKAGKKGAEGGIALRNIMTTLSKGEFLSKEAKEELTAAGVDMNTLADKSVTLGERLLPLKTVLNDAALFAKLFGRENSNAAMALVQGIDEMNRYTDVISGTSTAFDQAGIIMESYNQKKARMQARFDDFRISVFNAMGDFGIWIETVAGSFSLLSQFMSLTSDVGKAIMRVKSINFAGVFSSLSRMVTVARYRLLFLNDELRTGKMASIGFLGNIGRATAAIVRFATVGIWSGVKALGAWLLSLVTGGAASAGFASIASASFATFKVTATSACRSVGIAIMNIPIIGWIAAAITAIIALGVYFWNTSAKFRATVKGVVAAAVVHFKGLWDFAKTVFGAIGELITAAFSFDGKGISQSIDKMKKGFEELCLSTGTAFYGAYNAEMAASKEEEEKKKKEDDDNPYAVSDNILSMLNGDVASIEPTDNNPISGGLSSIGGSPDKADKIKNINVTIDKMIDKFEIHTTNMHEDIGKVKEMVAAVLTGAVNDVNYAL